MTSALVNFTCIMPTYGRSRAWIAASIEYFSRQDIRDCELLVLEERTVPEGGIEHCDQRVLHLHLSQRLSVGSKRNLACQHARGEIILHWDDDDWYSPNRISRQVNALLESGADVCGSSRPYFYEPATRRAWQYVYPDRGKPWVHGATLCYTKEFWKRNPFANINIGEDTHFLWSSRPKKVLMLAESDFYVGLIHPGNTSRKLTSDPRYRPVPVEELRELMGEDWAFYERFEVTPTVPAPLGSC
jgi:glycosyltransferase involved in cell wall biosynthesis